MAVGKPGQRSALCGNNRLNFTAVFPVRDNETDFLPVSVSAI
jgi:hypothetical protein